ncbi:hypothetical protein SLA2020_388820 [Shorea laevis]
MMNPSPLYMLSCLVVLLLLPLPSLFADPDPLQDFCIADLSASTSVNGFPCKPASNVTSDDFVFDGLSKEGNTTNIFGSSITLLMSFHFLGSTLLGVIDPSGPCHWRTGQLFIIPRGLVHFQRNVGPGKALFFTSFNSQLPGLAIVPTNLFGTTPTIPNDVLTKSFQVGDDVVNSIKYKFGS